MAFTTSVYNHTVKRVLGGEVSYANCKVMLLDNNAVFDATDTTLADVLAGAATEVSGNGWTAGGELIADLAASIVSTNDAKISGTEVRVRATGGPISAYAMVVFDDLDVDDAPLIYVDFGGVLTAGAGVDFLVPMTSLITGAI